MTKTGLCPDYAKRRMPSHFNLTMNVWFCVILCMQGAWLQTCNVQIYLDLPWFHCLIRYGIVHLADLAAFGDSPTCAGNIIGQLARASETGDWLKVPVRSCILWKSHVVLLLHSIVIVGSLVFQHPFLLQVGIWWNLVLCCSSQSAKISKVLRAAPVSGARGGITTYRACAKLAGKENRDGSGRHKFGMCEVLNPRNNKSSKAWKVISASADFVRATVFLVSLVF